MPAHYRPLLVGIHWPSAALVFTEDERVPKVALESTAEIDRDIGARQQEIQDLAQDMSPELAARFFELAQQQTVDREEARELASLALSVYGEYDDELDASNNISSDELLDLWADAFSQADDTIEAEQDGSDLGDSETLEISFSPSSFDPRQIVRVLTVYQMKDRSAKVGKGGVGPLVRDLLATSEARIHLIGHSFGAKVMLAAISDGPSLPRNVETMLLLQPAVNHLCFAENIPSLRKPGGYRLALDRVNQPILSTYSAEDRLLHDLFHLAIRRRKDLGEMEAFMETTAPPVSLPRWEGMARAMLVRN